jgi:type I restriction enzyme M protein
MSSVVGVIKGIQDIMRKDAGVDGDAQRLGQLAWMFFLKIFNDREEELALLQDDYVSPLPAPLRWSTWAANSEGPTGDSLLRFVSDDLFPTLKTLSISGPEAERARLVRNVFADAINYMKNGTLLRQVVNKINAIDFNSSEDLHHFGDVYERLLRDLQSAGNSGEFYTPRAVTQFMVDMLDPKIDETVLDPACGTGGFLADVIDYKTSHYQASLDDYADLQRSVMGVEKKALPHLLCTTNMMLHGIETPTNIRHDNTLSRPLRGYTDRDRVDIIVTNPPFGGIEEDGVEANFPQIYQTRETADLFLVLIVHLLKSTGRAAVVLPDGTLFGEGVKSRIKEKLLTECNLHTIVRLPNGVFNPYTGIKTNLLFFEKGRATKEVWFFEHRYPEGYKSYSKTKPLRIEEFQREKEWWGDLATRAGREANEFAWKVDIDEIRNRGFNLDIPNPHREVAAERDPLVLERQFEQASVALTGAQDRLRSLLAEALAGAGRP